MQNTALIIGIIFSAFAILDISGGNNKHYYHDNDYSGRKNGNSIIKQDLIFSLHNCKYFFSFLLSLIISNIFCEVNLPRGWTEHYSLQDQQYFYYDTINKISQWEKPTENAKGKKYNVYVQKNIITVKHFKY